MPIVYRSTCRPAIGRTFSVDMSTDTSTDMSADISWSIYRPSVGRYVNRYVGRVSADMSTDTAVGCRSIYRVIHQEVHTIHIMMIQIARHLFGSHWRRIASIVIYLVLQSPPTHVMAGPGYSAIAPNQTRQDTQLWLHSYLPFHWLVVFCQKRWTSCHVCSSLPFVKECFFLPFHGCLILSFWEERLPVDSSTWMRFPSEFGRCCFRKITSGSSFSCFLSFWNFSHIWANHKSLINKCKILPWLYP